MLMPIDQSNPALQQLIEALADRLVQDHLRENSAPPSEKPARRPNHARVAAADKAA